MSLGGKHHQRGGKPKELSKDHDNSSGPSLARSPLGSVPSACVLVSPLYMNRLCKSYLRLTMINDPPLPSAPRPCSLSLCPVSPLSPATSSSPTLLYTQFANTNTNTKSPPSPNPNPDYQSRSRNHKAIKLNTHGSSTQRRTVPLNTNSVTANRPPSTRRASRLGTCHANSNVSHLRQLPHSLCHTERR